MFFLVCLVIVMVVVWISQRFKENEAKLEILRQELDRLREDLARRTASPLSPRQEMPGPMIEPPAPPAKPPILSPTAPVSVPPPLSTSTPPASIPKAQPRDEWAGTGAISKAALNAQPILMTSAGTGGGNQTPLAMGEPPPPPPPARKLEIDWEQFMGVKLFAWLGGLALFLAAAFFVKYSFDNNLISPATRMTLSFLFGLGLLVGGVVLKHKDYRVTAETLCATGVVVLYAASFASHAYYHFLTSTPTFALMSLITIVAFLLSVHLEAPVVAILGIVGGFLTPPLLSTGVDRAIGLFGYIALLDAGLLAVALRKRWHYLAALGAAGTLLMEIGWAAKFFTVPKAALAWGIFQVLNLLFLGAVYVARRLGQRNPWLSGSAAALPWVMMGFALNWLQYGEIGKNPGIWFLMIFGADLCLLVLAYWDETLGALQALTGMAAFVLLGFWTVRYLDPALQYWGFGAFVVFAILHAVYPVILNRLRPSPQFLWWANVFPLLSLLLMTLPWMLRLELSAFLWLFILLVNLMVMGIAVATHSLLCLAGALLFTFIATLAWLLGQPPHLTSLPVLSILVIAYALLFTFMGLAVGRMVQAQQRGEGDPLLKSLLGKIGEGASSASETAHPLLAPIPVFSAILPFILLSLAASRLAMTNPSPLFGLGLVLLVLLLGLARFFRIWALAPVALGCILLVEYTWHFEHYSASHPWAPLLWYGGFILLFLLYPFVAAGRLSSSALPWAGAALAGPLHFLLIYRIIQTAFPNPYMGLVPAVMSLPLLAGLAVVLRLLPQDHKARLSALAWFGGCALFFITLVFPIQFQKHWITVGWALEGFALVWLFHRIPHPGLRLAGVGLLVVAFMRLALNPAVFHYYVRQPDQPRIFNWFLYTYGIAIICLFAGARWLAPPRHKLGRINLPHGLTALGTILSFILLNILIADYFSTGRYLSFEFNTNFARDMTYSIAWAVFAIVLLSIGAWKAVRATRYAALALLAVTLIKLFFHDLVHLSAPYRIGALAGVAILSMLASVIYQRFFASLKKVAESKAA